jgi:hypothetical protein
MSYVKQVLIAVDQLVNALLGGMADETLSCRAYRMYVRDRIVGIIAYKVINCIFFWEDDHCYSSYVSELNRRHLPKEFQKV